MSPTARVGSSATSSTCVWAHAHQPGSQTCRRLGRVSLPTACAEWNSDGGPTGIESIACALVARPATVPRYCVPFLRTTR